MILYIFPALFYFSSALYCEQNNIVSNGQKVYTHFHSSNKPLPDLSSFIENLKREL